MKLDKDKKNETVVMDLDFELVFANAIQCLIEGQGNIDLARKIFLGQQSLLTGQLDNPRNPILAEVEKILTYPDFALANLMTHLGDEANRRLVKAGNQLSSNVLEMIIIPPAFQPIINTFAGLALCISAGYTIDADSDLTYGLMRSNPYLYKMVTEVWSNAMSNIHPFQRGPTHQGTKHCVNVLDNLHALRCDLGINWPLEVRAMLSISAALHDVGKGDIMASLSDKTHAKKGAHLIRNPSIDFKLRNACKDIVATIVESHNPEPPVLNIRGLPKKDLHAGGIGVHINDINMEMICSFFQLADIMDITRDRVSDHVLEMVLALYKNNLDKDIQDTLSWIEDVVKARKGIISTRIVTGVNPCIKLIVSSKSPFLSEVNRRISRDNNDLITTGAEKVLRQNPAFPFKLVV